MQSVHFNTRPVPPRSPPTFLNLLPLHLFSPPIPLEDIAANEAIAHTTRQQA